MGTIDRIGIGHVDVERTTVISAQPFDTVVSKLSAAIGHPDMRAFARAMAAAPTSADLEGVVSAATGEAGLMEMARFDIGDVLRKEMDDVPRSLRLVIGNPLIKKENPTTSWRACWRRLEARKRWPLRGNSTTKSWRS